MMKLSNLRNGARGKLLAVLVIALALLGIVFWLIPESPVDKRAATNPVGYRATAEQFIKSMSTRDGVASYELLTDGLHNETGDPIQWQKQIDLSFAKGTGNPQFAREEQVPDPQGVYRGKNPHMVIYSFRFDGKPWETAMLIVKDGSSWKVDELKSYQK